MSMTAPKLTPMFEQYLSIKAQYPDALLFYRMGDFYEMFFEDAEVAARELQITLTCRNPNADCRVPMCGVPHHAADTYLPQLLDKGYKVAICDQVEDPRQAKGLVKREVVRVLTPGTVVEDNSLTAKNHTYLAALCWDRDKGQGGLAWVDVSTGEWSGIQTRKEHELWQWALKMGPREIILPEEMAMPAGVAGDGVYVNRVPFKAFFDPRRAEEKLLRAQRVASLQVLDLDDKRELTGACGALISYLTQTQKQDPAHLWQFKPLNLSRHLLLDELTERNLEIFRTLDGRTGKGTLWWVLDKTMTPMGGRLLRERLRHPWRDLSPATACLDVVAWLHGADDMRAALRQSLDQVFDMERLATRIFLGRATPKDFVALRQSLAALPLVRAALASPAQGHEADEPHPTQQPDAPVPDAVRKVLAAWDDLEDFCTLLQRALVDSPPHVITEGGLFRTGYDAALDECIDLAEHGEGTLQALLERERATHAIPKLRLGYNRVFGYYFEAARTMAVPGHFIRRQTLAGSERYTTEELKTLEDKLLTASDNRKALEYKLFQALRQTVADARQRFLYMADVLAALDMWQGLAETARRWNWVRPELHLDTAIAIKGGRHPVVEAMQGSGDFIPNDLALDEERKLLLITGPNMAGKSTVLRQAAIITLLAQMGSFVPAHAARIGMADRIFSRVGASDNLAMGQSTFMVEMTETARILRQATRRSLVILDEIGRGTSTFDGLALAWAVVEELAKRGDSGIRTLFATHYHELTVLEGHIPGVRNMNIAVKEWGGEIVFLRRMVPGPSDRSYGIEVAKLAGVPRPVVERAKTVLAELEAKARDRDDTLTAPRAVAQSLLPGFAPCAEGAPAAAGHPMLDALRSVDVDRLTPMDALTLLNRWKKEWGNE
ncbi:MAG: DNA mismatch repair protein MutS [Desulfovibrionaceae bacterium]